MASVWKGSVSFGLVNIPVSVHSAVKEDKIAFRMLSKEQKGGNVVLTPIGYEKVKKSTGESVSKEKSVKGFEYEKGSFVEVTSEDLKKAAQSTLDTFDIEDFVPETEIDPRFYEKPYFIVPEKGADKAYVLLRDSMKETGMVGIGRFTMKNKQYLGSIKAVGNALILDVMRFNTELVPEEAHRFPTDVTMKPQEIKIAKQLIAQLAGTFDPLKYRDEYKENLEKIIQSKVKGVTVKLGKGHHQESGAIIDLMERLQQSLAQSGASRDLPTNIPVKKPKAQKASSLPLDEIVKPKPGKKKSKSDSLTA
ncbi:MAG: Ku protein [Sphingobacteriales bacterium]|nr:MAG: Ku protein [Sphingobacteriales bacterium]